MSTLEKIKRHIKTHSERSAEDVAAVSYLQNLLQLDGKINTNFASNDKWPNTDGTFEYVSNPDISRQPEQNFFVQIKGTKNLKETDEGVKYALTSLAFPAFVYSEVTFDPCILFVVFNRSDRGNERVFWKYVSAEFLNSIDFDKESTTITFKPEEEIKNTDESVNCFCNKLKKIAEHHTFIKQLDGRQYTKAEVEEILKICNEDICEKIERLDIFNETRDSISKKMLCKLYDICTATLLLNTFKIGVQQANIQLAWEQSLLDIKTKYLSSFLKGLKYLGNKIPQNGQSERLLLKYYDYLWQIRYVLKADHNIDVLINLEKFPRNMDKTDEEYYKLVAEAIEKAPFTKKDLTTSRYYIQKKTPFFIGKERYYEITLQLAGLYATKYNRITVYTKEQIPSSYSIKIAYEERSIKLWDINTNVKVLSAWNVSIEPTCLNKLAKALLLSTKVNSNYGEYTSLMDNLRSGLSILDIIDFDEKAFDEFINKVYSKTNTTQFKEVLIRLHNSYSKSSNKFGKNSVRFLLLNLREENFEKILPNQFSKKCLSDDLYISSKCYPFEKKPFLSSIAGSNTSNGNSLQRLIEVADIEEYNLMRPYVTIQNHVKETGEIYFDENLVDNLEDINTFNSLLDSWERKQGYGIKKTNGHVFIQAYEDSTLDILRVLLRHSKSKNAGQEAYNRQFIEKNQIYFDDRLKEIALKKAFVNSKVLMVYGAAGTGKTFLLNHLSNLMNNKKKLFLTKTHTALQNLRRGISNHGVNSEFVSIDSFTKKVELSDFDVIFVDECSTIDNQVMLNFLSKINENTFLVLAGDIYQIESINFGNWFYYAKDIIINDGASVELLSTWRTKDKDLINLWIEVRNKDILVTEKLVIDGPFSEDISQSIFNKSAEDEVVLCLNYDGKFGLNNINAYFQNANTQSEAISWREWTYKIGDKILFNNSNRFSVLYNNLKGKIVDIHKKTDEITFVIDVDAIITEHDCKRDGIDFIDIVDDSTRISFSVFNYDADSDDPDEELSKEMCVVPFQLAYAVSIHKAQGLEYDSVKIVIPSSNSEKITHSIFYTAITRSKEHLKIFWSSETMQEIVKGFSVDHTENKSLEIVKEKLGLNQ